MIGWVHRHAHTLKQSSQLVFSLTLALAACHCPKQPLHHSLGLLHLVLCWHLAGSTGVAHTHSHSHALHHLHELFIVNVFIIIVVLHLVELRCQVLEHSHEVLLEVLHIFVVWLLPRCFGCFFKILEHRFCRPTKWIVDWFSLRRCLWLCCCFLWFSLLVLLVGRAHISHHLLQESPTLRRLGDFFGLLLGRCAWLLCILLDFWFLNDFELLHHSVQRLFSLLWRWFLSLG
jgi:hypothetical protein